MFSMFHFVPFCFVVGILFTTILAVLGCPLLGWLMWFTYGLLIVGISLLEIFKKPRSVTKLALLVLFLLLHVSYGVVLCLACASLHFILRIRNEI